MTCRRATRLSVCLGAALAAVATAAATGAAGLAGTWVATGPFGKITLRLHTSGAAYAGTYTLVLGGKQTVSHVSGRSDNADGATQLTLTFTPSRRSDLCGLSGSRLYCQLGAGGTAAFSRA
jgi:hypothetical protein